MMNDNAQNLRQSDLAHYMHPFTDTEALGKEGGARIITRAEGAHIWDISGNKILDGMAGLWCVNIGYGRKELADAAARQMNTLPYYNSFFKTATVPSIELAEQLAARTPAGLNHVFYANSGSEANDTIVRMVRYYWELEGEAQRQIIIGRNHGYHGSTSVTASLSGPHMHGQGGVPLPGFSHIAAPYLFGADTELDAEAFGIQAAQALEERILELGADKVAAFIGEPVQGSGGMIVPPASYWGKIQRICKKYGVLLIADEVITGFGRTGKWFASELYDIKPDLMTLAKGLSSGYLPISAVIVGDRVANTIIHKGSEFVHGFTYSGHPVSCAVALENIRIIADEGLVENAATVGDYLQTRLRDLKDHPLVGEVRGIGLLGAIELVQSKSPRRFFETKGEVGTRCRDHCFANSLVMRAVRDTMIISPPLMFSKAHVDELLEKARKALDSTWADLCANKIEGIRHVQSA
ncbi:aspartate aminotransferase family protein [Acidithiobacillus ferrianus]|uniref:Aspartate aminotransferase family protein n=2 Tax=Acidithiobacillus ferrianus TaxID=2678518 RepID=A0ACD5H4V2_9PROT|nr:aspartate aminotransferase family protein [Acidithiobacillus ferrianus]